MKLKALWISLSVLTVGAVVTVPVVMTLINQTKSELKKPIDVVPPINDSSIIQTKEIKFDSATNTILGWSDEIIESGNTPTHLELPNEINGVVVTHIGDSAFYEAGLISVKLPSSLSEIGDSAFWQNKLTEIDFPPSLVEIGDSAFWQNKLTEIDFPPSLVEIGDYAFWWNKLTEIDFPPSLVEIGDSAFAWNNIHKLKIPGHIKFIGAFAFSFNSQLTELSIEDGTEEIGRAAFEGSPISQLDLGSTVKKIGHGAFNLHNLNELTIPDSVEYIGAGAFKSHPTKPHLGISKLNLSSATNLVIDDYAFAYNQLKEFTVTNNLTIGAEAFSRNPIGKITFDNEVAKEVSESSGHFNYDQTKIGLGAFSLIEIPSDQRVLKQNFIMPHMWFHGTAVWDRLFNKDMNFWFDVIRCKTADVCDLA